jgi:enamine deaminase RidA (YjgF/YER057c/UK114 family)
MSFARWVVVAAMAVGMTGAAGAAEYMEKTDFQKSRAFSPAVITEGGRIVWMAGQTATRDEAGNDISGNFEAQVRTVFALMDKTLKNAGGSLANLVTMTVFINDPRNGDRFVELRRDTFKDGNFPASALITVSNFARPGMLIEIQGVAVIGDAPK